MTYLRVAKPGYNAITDTNPQHFYFNSDYDTFKFIQTLSQLTITVSNSGGNLSNGSTSVSTSVTLPSSFTYTPYINCFINMAGTLGYNAVSNAGSYVALTYYDPSTNSIVLSYYYGNTGTQVDTVTALPYLFGNSI